MTSNKQTDIAFLRGLKLLFDDSDIVSIWQNNLADSKVSGSIDIRGLPDAAFHPELPKLMLRCGLDARSISLFSSEARRRWNGYEALLGGWPAYKQWLRRNDIFKGFRNRSIENIGIRNLSELIVARTTIGISAHNWIEEFSLGELAFHVDVARAYARNSGYECKSLSLAEQQAERTLCGIEKGCDFDLGRPGDVYLVAHSRMRIWLVGALKKWLNSSLMQLRYANMATDTSRRAQMVLMVKQLRKGGQVCLAIDGRQGLLNSNLELFGKQTPVSTGPAWLCYQEAKRIIWLYSVENPSGYGMKLAHQVIPLPTKAEPFEQYQLRFFRAISSAIEDTIASNPFSFGTPGTFMLAEHFRKIWLSGQ